MPAPKRQVICYRLIVICSESAANSTRLHAKAPSGHERSLKLRQPAVESRKAKVEHARVGTARVDREAAWAAVIERGREIIKVEDQEIQLGASESK
jgi:hypothetical protein